MSYSPEPAVMISKGDLRRLRSLAYDLVDELNPVGPLLLTKLAQAEPYAFDQVPADRVTLDSFTTYRLSGSQKNQRRLLIHPRDTMWPPAELSVASPLGIALLGRAAGDRVLIAGTGMEERPWVEVLGVEAGGVSGLVRVRFPRGSQSSVVGGSALMA